MIFGDGYPAAPPAGEFPIDSPHPYAWPPDQLYDLAADRAETKNLAAEKPDIVQRLTALLDKFIADGRSTPGDPQKNAVTIQVRKETKAAKKRDAAAK